MPIPVRVLRFNQRYLNKLTIKLAGRGYLADLEHVGRKPGVTYHTPIMAFQHGDTLTTALTYGPNVQWLKNIRAAGHLPDAPRPRDAQARGTPVARLRSRARPDAHRPLRSQSRTDSGVAGVAFVLSGGQPRGPGGYRALLVVGIVQRARLHR